MKFFVHYVLILNLVLSGPLASVSVAVVSTKEKPNSPSGPWSPISKKDRQRIDKDNIQRRGFTAPMGHIDDQYQLSDLDIHDGGVQVKPQSWRDWNGRPVGDRYEEAQNRQKKIESERQERLKTQALQSWTEPKENDEKAQAGAPMDSRQAEEKFKVVAAEKARFLFERSMILAIEQTINQKEVTDFLIRFYQENGGYIINYQDLTGLTQTFQDQYAKNVFLTSYQKIINRAYAIAFANLAQWSAQAKSSGWSFLNKSYSLYDIAKPELSKLFETAANLKSHPVLAARVLETIQNAVGLSVENLAKKADEAFKSKHQTALEEIVTIQEFIEGKGFAPRPKGTAITPIGEAYEKATASSSGSTKNRAQSSKTIYGDKASVLIDLSKASDGKGSMKNEGVSAVTIEMPDVSYEEIVANNPETLAYRFRRPLTAGGYFFQQYILFQIPMWFVTVALIGLDNPKNPLAMDQLEKSFSDPGGIIGFGAFVATNHKVATTFDKIIKNKNLRFLLGPLGMAAGMLAQSVFSDIWNDKNFRACARSQYAPGPDTFGSCNSAWNDWIVTNKMAKYTPAIMGLLSTALAAGVTQTVGVAAIKSAKQNLQIATSAALEELQKAFANDPLTRDPKAKWAAVKSSAEASKEALESLLNKGMDAARAHLPDRVRNLPKVILSLKRVQLAQQKVAYVIETTNKWKSIVGESLSATKGRVGFKIKEFWTVSKTAFGTPEELEAYVLKMKKLKGILNVSLVTIGTNLVFLALDPFISEPMHKSMGLADLKGWDFYGGLSTLQLFQTYEIFPNVRLNTIPETIGAFIFHQSELPHEKDFQTVPQVLNAYNTSLNTFMDNGFEDTNILSCYGADPKSLVKNEAESLNAGPATEENPNTKFLNNPDGWFASKAKALRRWALKGTLSSMIYSMNKGAYSGDPECVTHSDFKGWLKKYSEIERTWRDLQLSQVTASLNSWTTTIDNFITNYDTTSKFYGKVVEKINEYQTTKARKGKAEIDSEMMDRSALINLVKELSQVPPKEEWNDQQKAKFETLYPDTVKSFDTPDYADYLIASMACGPDPEAPVSFGQRVRSMSWAPWDEMAKIAPSIFSTWATVVPNSPIVETYPGTSFKYLSPRITPAAPSEICGEPAISFKPNKQGFTPTSPMGLYQRPIFYNGVKYKNIIHYIFETAHSRIVTPGEFDHFEEWNKSISTSPIFDPQNGVWPVATSNFKNLMKHHFFPLYRDASMDIGCPKGDGIHCALYEDQYLRANGLVYSAVNEVYTYLRTLRKIGYRLSEGERFQNSKNEFLPLIKGNPGAGYVAGPTEECRAMKALMEEDFDKYAQKIAFVLMDKRTAVDNAKTIDIDERFESSYAIKKIEEFQEKFLRAIPYTKAGLGALTTANLLFEKIRGVATEIESYNKYAKLDFKNDKNPDATQKAVQEENRFNPSHRVR